jgi:hypothetical protein
MTADFSPIKVQIAKMSAILCIASISPRAAAVQLRHIAAHAAMAVAMFAPLCGTASAQAPIRERSDAVSTIDAARRAADAAHNATVGAQSRLAEAGARVQRATEAAAAARKEEDAARAEHAAALDAVARARSGENRAQAALTRALEQRD